MGFCYRVRASAGIKGGVDDAVVRHVRSVCESRCEWLRRTIIEAVLYELTRCWSVLTSRCRSSSGPRGLSCWPVVCRVCSLSR